MCEREWGWVRKRERNGCVCVCVRSQETLKGKFSLSLLSRFLCLLFGFFFFLVNMFILIVHCNKTYPRYPPCTHFSLIVAYIYR